MKVPKDWATALFGVMPSSVVVRLRVDGRPRGEPFERNVQLHASKSNLWVLPPKQRKDPLFTPLIGGRVVEIEGVHPNTLIFHVQSPGALGRRPPARPAAGAAAAAAAVPPGPAAVHKLRSGGTAPSARGRPGGSVTPVIAPASRECGRAGDGHTLPALSTPALGVRGRPEGGGGGAPAVAPHPATASLQPAELQTLAAAAQAAPPAPTQPEQRVLSRCNLVSVRSVCMCAECVYRVCMRECVCVCDREGERESGCARVVAYCNAVAGTLLNARLVMGPWLAGRASRRQHTPLRRCPPPPLETDSPPHAP